MVLTYSEAGQGRGKSTEDTDIVEGRFLELIPNEKIVEAVEFESADPAFAGTMMVTAVLTAVANGTKVTLTADNVPPGISEAEHRAGMDSTLKSLANFIE